MTHKKFEGKRRVNDLFTKRDLLDSFKNILLDGSGQIENRGRSVRDLPFYLSRNLKDWLGRDDAAAEGAVNFDDGELHAHEAAKMVADHFFIYSFLI